MSGIGKRTETFWHTVANSPTLVKQGVNAVLQNRYRNLLATACQNWQRTPNLNSELETPRQAQRSKVKESPKAHTSNKPTKE
jgi:alanine dehydrogenase